MECPVCHEPTEVYSRITGYYRPVKNWDDGKVQKYKDRKIYQVHNDTMEKMDKNNVLNLPIPTFNRLYTILPNPKKMLQ